MFACSTLRLQVTITGDEYIEDVISLTVADCTVCLSLLHTSVCVEVMFTNHFHLQTVNNIFPTSYCRGQSPEITLLGSDLDANLDQELANCRFKDQISGLVFS